MKKKLNLGNLKSKGLIITVVTVFIISLFFIRGVFTGYVVYNDEIISKDRFVVIDLNKDENSILNVKIKTSKLSTILIEMEDCDNWKNGQDDDNMAMDKYENIKEISFNIGDPSLNTLQQMELYKANKICLIVGNLEGGENKILINAKEGSKDRWNIVE